MTFSPHYFCALAFKSLLLKRFSDGLGEENERTTKKDTKRGNVNIKSIITRECEYVLCVCMEKRGNDISTMGTEQEKQTVAIVMHAHVVVVATVRS